MLDTLNFPPPSEELWIQHLRTQQVELLSLGKGGIEESRLEDYVVGGLVDFDDISYDDHADLLYDLAGQTVNHFRGYLSEEDTRRVLRCHQKTIVQFIHAQMQDHFWEEATGYEVKVSRGFTAIKVCAFTSTANNPIRDFRQAPPDKKNIARYVFGGFERCLYSALKFQSDTERKLAVILDRDSQKWFKPAKGQFQLFYLWNGEHLEYQPDFVAETDSTVYMLEPKAVSNLQDAEVLAKRAVAVKWCRHASDYFASYGGKPWQYALIPHDAISENMTLAGLANRYVVKD
jgi:type III restriction enzyme